MRCRPFLCVALLGLLFTPPATATEPWDDGFFATFEQLDDAHHASALVLDATVPMTCFPPEAGISPPCIVPTGIDPSLVAPNPSGELRIRVREDDSTSVAIHLDGMAEDLVVTAWFIFNRPDVPPPHPIFAPIGPGLPPVAAVNIPLAATTAAYTEGLGPEPNSFRLRQNGKGTLIARLDYNPLKANQAPLRNGMVEVNQGLAPAGSPAEQPPCCPDAVVAPGSRPHPIGSSLLRQVDPATGFEVLRPDGRPELVRSPIPVLGVLVTVHMDRTTHGIHPGIPVPPFPGSNFPATAGSYYILGVFPLGQLRM